MTEKQRPEDAEYWCPEHGDDALQGSCIDEEWVDLDRYGNVERVREGYTNMSKAWCGLCNRVLLEQEEESPPAWQLLESDIQSFTEYDYGRKLTEEELSRVIKGLEYSLGEYSADVMGELIAGIMLETDTKPVR